MRIDTSLRLRLMLGVSILAATATPAVAEAPAAPAPVATEPAVAEPAPADADQGLSDIVVTATKRETNLQKTPIAISVLSAEAIKDRHVQSLLDLADGGIPSLRVATFEARQSALTIGIRGIVPFDQNQTARDSGVGVYIDGVYLGRSQGLNAALFDVERIEVLKGPQGTLFGRNTEGGALSIVTKAPSGTFGGRMSAGFGNYGSYGAEAHVDLPEFQNIAIKVDGVVQHQDPTTKNPLAGQVGWNAYHRVGGRIAARWNPFDGFTADLSFDKAKDENTPFFSQLVNYNPLNRPVGVLDRTTNRLVLPGSAAGAPTCISSTVSATTCIAPLPSLVRVHSDRQKTADVGVPQQYSVDKTQGVGATLSYVLSPDLTLRSITSWRKVQTNQWDNSGGPNRVAFSPNGKFSRYSLSDLNQSQFSQEVQAVGSLPNLDYVVGLYYFNEHARETAATPTTNQWNADGTAYTILPSQVFGPITSSNQGWDYNSRFLQRGSVARTRSYAAFGQATYTPDFAGEKVHITVGGRYTKDKRDGALYIVSGVATPYTLDYDRGRFDPMATVAFDAAPGINLYAKYSSGFRGGGANDRSSNFGAFGPEVVKAYEIGAKTDFLDHKVRLNLAGLHHGPVEHPDRFRFRRYQPVPAGHDHRQSELQPAHREHRECAGNVQDPRDRGGPDRPSDRSGHARRVLCLYLHKGAADGEPQSGPDVRRHHAGLYRLHAEKCPVGLHRLRRADRRHGSAGPSRRQLRQFAIQLPGGKREDRPELHRQRTDRAGQHPGQRDEQDHAVGLVAQPVQRTAYLSSLGSERRGARRLCQLQPAAHDRRRTGREVLNLPHSGTERRPRREPGPFCFRR